jgi:hypothetical protein
LNFESKIHKAQLKNKSQRKALKGHLEKGKNAKLTNGMKSSKPRKKAQTQNSP